jgi:hypothetical protein
MKKTFIAPAIALSLPGNFGSMFTSTRDSGVSVTSRFGRGGNMKKNIVKILILAVALGLVVWGGKTLANNRTVTTDPRIDIKPPKATQKLAKEFQFPLKNEKGETVTNIKYSIETAELHDEIITGGKRGTSVKGRTFLIIPLKITNTYTQSIEIQAKDYVRLIVGGKESEPLAADIHNDPVTIQALSTKYTRIGFPINDSDRNNLVLKVGELSGQKQSIKLELK